MSIHEVLKQDSLIQVDKEKGIFRVPRWAFTDPEILKIEKEKIFNKCWLYLGHESELPNPGDFKTRKVIGRNLIFNRDSSGKINAFFNTCTHRGALVCREREGNCKVFQCFYHAWTFSNNGELAGQPGGQHDYPEGFRGDPMFALHAVPRLESYRGFVFINFDSNAMPLEQYLAGAKEYIDLVADQSEFGMEVVKGSHQYSTRANWKLLYENSEDGYHGLPTHKTYFEYLQDANGRSTYGEHSIAKNLGNGHTCYEREAPWGRPIGEWVPSWGEEAKQDVEQSKQRLISRLGEERADKIVNLSTNLVIFPNLAINDIMSLTIRTWDPVAPDYMDINVWCLGPKEETALLRSIRITNFLEFLGPAGFASPDDNEALELCQQGYNNSREVQWNDISKGFFKELRGETPNHMQEYQMRTMWTRWNELLLSK